MRQITPVIAAIRRNAYSGLYVSQATARTSTWIKEPHIKAKIPTAKATMPLRSAPTKGIQERSLIIGLKSKKCPTTFINQETALIIVVCVLLAYSKSSRISEGCLLPTSMIFKTSLKIALNSISVSQQQIQTIGHPASRGGSLLTCLILSGFHYLNVYSPLSSYTYCAITVTA